MALQVGEDFFLGSLLIQPFLTLYLLLRACIHGLSRPDIIIQVNFANRAALNCLAQQKPNPPIDLGTHKSSQAFQAKYLPDFYLDFTKIDE